MPVSANNPAGNPSTLIPGGPKKAGVALAGQRIRMPDEASHAALIARLATMPRTGRAQELGRLLVLALSIEQA